MLLWVTGFYLVYKLYSLVAGPGVAAAFAGTTEANMYLLEMVVGVVLPIVLLISKANREKMGMVLTVNILVIVGVTLNRINVSIFGSTRTRHRRGAVFPLALEFNHHCLVACRSSCSDQPQSIYRSSTREPRRGAPSGTTDVRSQSSGGAISWRPAVDRDNTDV
jgi:hypothetical protein